MAIPVPSEERTIKPILWRSHKKVLPPGDIERIHADERKRLEAQETFSSSPTHYLYRGLSESDEGRRKEGIKCLSPPPIRDRFVRKKPPDQCLPLTDKQVLDRLFPPGGLSQPQSVEATASIFASAKGHTIEESVSPQKVPPCQRRINREFVEQQQARSHSSKGDMSIAKCGVKRVPVETRCASTDLVAGFEGMGRRSTPPKPTGLKRVVPFQEDWDPLHYKAMYGRSHQ